MKQEDQLTALGMAMQIAEARQAQAAEYLADCLCDEARLLEIGSAKLRYRNAREAHERAKDDYEKAYRQGETDAILPVTKEERKMIATGEVPARSVSDIRRLAKAYEVRLTVTEEDNKRLRDALEPFYADRDYCPHLDGPVSDACHAGTVGPFEITMGHLRAVRNTLSKGKEGNDAP